MSKTYPINIQKVDPLVIDIDYETKNNIYYRRVIHTGIHSQTVLMSLEPGIDIGAEIHYQTDQFIKIEGGSGYAQLGNNYYPIKEGSSINIPAGTYHNIINNSGSEPLKLYTVYSPPIHRPNTLKLRKNY